MRLMIALLAGLVMAQPTFAAPKNKKKPAPVKRVKSKFEVSFLSYNQLASLTPAKRMKYIRDIASLMMRMERANAHYEVANGMTLDELKYQFAALQQWLQFMPEANAREWKRNVPQTSTGIMTYDGSAFACGQGYELDLSIPACLKLHGNGTTYWDSRGHADGASCADDMVEITHPDPKAAKTEKGCMSREGFAKLSPERREALQSGRDVFLDPNAFQRLPREAQLGLAYGGTSGVAPGGNPGSGIAGDSAAPAAPAPATPAPGAVAPAPGAAVPAPVQPGQAIVTPAPAEPAPPAAVVPAPQPPAPAPAPEPAPPVAEDPKADACIPEPTTCEEPTDAAGKKARDEAIARFRKTAKFGDVDANMCITGGFLSRYTTATKQAGTCDPVLNFGPKAKCDPGWIMCNPALFCHTKTTKDKEGKDKTSSMWFCVEKKKIKDYQWTAACAEEYNSRITKKGFITEDKEQIAKACDPKDVNMPKAMADEWNRLMGSLKEMVDGWCGEKAKDFKVLFCRECQIITAQVYKMKKDATGSGCAKAPGAAAETETPARTDSPQTEK